MQKLANVKAKISKRPTVMQKYYSQLRNIQMLKKSVESRPIKVAVENLEAAIRKQMETKTSKLVETALSKASAIAQPQAIAKPNAELERLEEIATHATDAPVIAVVDNNAEEDDDEVLLPMDETPVQVQPQNVLMTPPAVVAKSISPKAPKKQVSASKSTSGPTDLMEKEAPKYVELDEESAKAQLFNPNTKQSLKIIIAGQLLCKFLARNPYKYDVDITNNKIVDSKNNTAFKTSNLQDSCAYIMAGYMGLSAGAPPAHTDKLEKRLAIDPEFADFIEDYKIGRRRAASELPTKSIIPSSSWLGNYFPQTGKGRKRRIVEDVNDIQPNVQTPFRAERWHRLKI